VSPLLLFAGLLALYHLNGDVLPGNDAKPNVYLPVSLLSEGNLSFTPREMPFMFHWALRSAGGQTPVRVRTWDQPIDGVPARVLAERQALVPVAVQYYLMPTRRIDPSSGHPLFVGLYGPGAGLTAVPVMFALRLATGDLTHDPVRLWYAGKFTAAAAVAASAVCVWLAALRFTSRRRALLIALAYGAGTCVWSVSSQSLWQHGPAELFLAAGTAAFLAAGTGWHCAALCGLAYGLATACRPTGAIVAAVVGAYVLATDRRRFAAYAAGVVPVAAALAAYNQFYFGSVFELGLGARRAMVLESTQGAGLWSTPPWEGAAGLLVSPARGLLVHSPFLVFAFWGAVRAWRDATWRILRPLTVAVLLLLLVPAGWFSWWGGWSFGYRLIVDTMPLLVLFLLPVLDRVCTGRWTRAVFAVFLGWSVAVQVVGAFAYDVTGWNARVAGYEVRLPGEPQPRVVAERAEAERLAQAHGGTVGDEVTLDVDAREHRHRLWSLRDSPLVYYLGRFREARRAKRELIRVWLADPAA
jgi:hypothetical protein